MKKIFHLKFDVTEYIVSSYKWKIFSNFEAFSEYPNFNVNFSIFIYISLTALAAILHYLLLFKLFVQ